MNQMIEMLRKDIGTDVHAIFEEGMGLEAAAKAQFQAAFAPYEA